MGGISLATLATLAKLALYVLQAFGWANNLAERRAGRREVENEINAENLQKQKDMANAQAAAPTNRGDLADRLRRESASE